MKGDHVVPVLPAAWVSIEILKVHDDLVTKLEALTKLLWRHAFSKLCWKASVLEGLHDRVLVGSVLLGGSELSCETVLVFGLKNARNGCWPAGDGVSLLYALEGELE